MIRRQQAVFLEDHKSDSPFKKIRCKQPASRRKGREAKQIEEREACKTCYERKVVRS